MSRSRRVIERRKRSTASQIFIERELAQIQDGRATQAAYIRDMTNAMEFVGFVSTR